MYDYKVNNIVMKATTIGNIDVRNVVETVGFGSYNPLVFSAVTLKFLNPKVTINVFSTGILMALGSKTIYGALYVIHYLKMKLKLKIASIDISNMLVTYNTGSPIDIDEIVSNNKNTCLYDSSLFPSCVYKSKASIFSTGKMTIYGSKTLEGIEETIEDVLVNVLKKSKKDDTKFDFN